jgi:hypothetical protein
MGLYLVECRNALLHTTDLLFLQNYLNAPPPLSGPRISHNLTVKSERDELFGGKIRLENFLRGKGSREKTSSR